MIAALYTRPESVYDGIDGVTSWNAIRDATKYPGPYPVVAHPPCRSWGKLRAMAKPRPDERELALHALNMVRLWGGVLEHPEQSLLFGEHCAKPGTADSFGFTISVDQSWWGHRATKRTGLYIVGIGPAEIPAYNPFAYSTRTVELMGRAERERTPRAFALWLVEIARRVQEKRLYLASQYAVNLSAE